MKNIIIKDLWLKTLALFLAFITWFYVVGELNKGTLEEKAFFGLIMPHKVEAKEVPIKITLVGKPFARHRILSERLSVKPASCLILASKNLLDNINYVVTEEIDISEFTKSVVKQVKIKPVGPGIILEKGFFVTVVVPIEKVEEATEVKR